MSRLFFMMAFAWASALAPGAALACPICLPSQGGAAAPFEQLASASAIVLAKPQAGSHTFEAVAAIKGRALSVSPLEVADSPAARADFPAGEAAVLVRHPLAAQWRMIGAIPLERAAWLRRVAAMPPAPEPTSDDWPARVRFFAPDLFVDDRFVSDVAASQIAQAPYTVMRSLRGQLDGAQLVAAADRIENIPHIPLLILLMGIVNDPPARAFVTQRLAAAGSLANANELAALLTAHIEIEGEAAFPFRAAQALRSASPRPSDLGAAVMALAILGSAFEGQRRDQIRQIYRAMLEERPEIAGYVARTMEDWRDWSLAEEVAQASHSTRVDQAARLLTRSYLESAGRAR
jgi:hypothetical protein